MIIFFINFFLYFLILNIYILNIENKLLKNRKNRTYNSSPHRWTQEHALWKQGIQYIVVYKGGSLKQPSVPHRFDPHLLGPLLLVSTPAVPLADRKSFPLAPLLNNKPLTSRQSTLKTATYIRVYARHNSVLATRNPFIGRSIWTIYWEKKFCAKRREREKEKEKEGVRGTLREFKVLHNFASDCVSLWEILDWRKKQQQIDSECRSFDTKRKINRFSGVT